MRKYIIFALTMYKLEMIYNIGTYSRLIPQQQSIGHWNFDHVGTEFQSDRNQ